MNEDLIRRLRNSEDDPLITRYMDAATLLEAADTLEAMQWQPIETAPKGPVAGSKWWGPRILICTKHHGHRAVFIGRYHHGAHKRFLDEADNSCVSAGDRGDKWMPLPTPPEAP